MTSSADDVAPPWNWSSDDISDVGNRVIAMVASYLSELPAKPVFQPVPEELRSQFHAAAPTTPTPPAQILDEFAEVIAGYPFGNGHPRFFGWVNSPPATIGIFAELLAASMNPSVAGGNHAAVHLEHQVIRWLAEMLGMPAGTGGLLVSGGSDATLTALAAARHRAATRAGLDVRADGVSGARFTVHIGEETHGCVRKAVELLGLGSNCLRVTESDGNFRMRPDLLAAALDADLAAGRTPMAVVASAGTVNTGAVDALPEIASVCADRGVWLHIDGAYGGPAVALDFRYQRERTGFAAADSVAVDPHKWMYVPVDAGAVLLRDPTAARDAFSLVPPYLRTDDDFGGVTGPVWFSEYGFDQTRPFRALKVWMAIKYFGVDGYRSLIAHDIDLADDLSRLIKADGQLELLAAGLSVVCFRFRPGGVAGPVDDLNRAILRDVQLGGRAFVAGTTVRGAFALRACIVNPGAATADIAELLSAVRDAGARLLA